MTTLLPAESEAQPGGYSLDPTLERTHQQVQAILAQLTDPEIPVISLAELGILRNIFVGHSPNGGVMAEVTITPTYGGCPAMEQIRDDIIAALAQAGFEARVSTRLAPAWTTDWISASGREKLRAYGIAPPHSAESPSTHKTIQIIRNATENIAKSPYLTGAEGQFSADKAQLLETIPCPRCGSANTVETSRFGSTACKSLWRCLSCQEPFDYFKPF